MKLLWQSPYGDIELSPKQFSTVLFDQHGWPDKRTKKGREFLDFIEKKEAELRAAYENG